MFSVNDCYWWLNCQFIPNDDTSLMVTSVAYQLRNGLSNLHVKNIPIGRVCRFYLESPKLSKCMFFKILLFVLKTRQMSKIHWVQQIIVSSRLICPSHCCVMQCTMSTFAFNIHFPLSICCCRIMLCLILQCRPFRHFIHVLPRSTCNWKVG